MKKINKILLVVPSYSSFLPPIESALKKLKVKSYYFDNRKTTISEKFLFLLSNIFDPFYMRGTKSINLRLLSKVKKFRPDLVIAIKGENLTGKYIQEIKTLCPIVNWFPDYLKDFDLAEDWLNSYSLFFTGDEYEAGFYKSKGFKNIHLLPYAGPAINDIPREKIYDLVFIGSYSKKREKILLVLKNFGLKIWGNQNWQGSKLKDCYMGKWLKFEETLDVLEKSKISINIHDNTKKYNTVLNMRVYESTACGALLITDRRINIENMFKIDEEIVIYDNDFDLQNKVKKYLKNEELRQKIAENGYRRLNKDHTYEKRLQKMFSLIN